MEKAQPLIDELEGLNTLDYQMQQFTEYVTSLDNSELVKRWLALGDAMLNWMAQTRSQGQGEV